MNPMKSIKTGSIGLGLAALVLCAGPLAHADADDNNAYIQHNLVSDGPIRADHTDANLVNGWGITSTPTSPTWVSDNGTGVSTLYDGLGNIQPRVVTIPGGDPTGVVYNPTSDFVVTKGATSGASLFIFATENGIIAGWSANVDPSNAITAVDNSASSAVYKGIAIAADGTHDMLYATNFRSGKIDVFDNAFHPVALGAAAFSDPHLPDGFAPFGIRNINGNLYVTYAKQDAAKHDDVAGQGFGFVNVFDASGKLIRRFATRGQLNSPWGLALAPADFGRFSNDLLVGNFGDGRINAYDLASGNFRGQLRTADSKPLTIDGLWGLNFGNGFRNQPTNVLFFAAGPNGENNGLYGRIEAVTP